MKWLTKKEIEKLAFSKNVDDRRRVSKYIRTPKAILLKLLLDEDEYVRKKAQETIKRKEELAEEIRILWYLKHWYKKLREKCEKEEEVSENEWEKFQTLFWGLNIVNKKFEKWFNDRFGPDAIKNYDKIDYHGYYVNTFMETVLTRPQKLNKREVK